VEPRTRIDLPPHVAEPYEVFVNGVPQERGRDFEVVGRTLVFHTALAREGRLGFWRWASLFLGVAGTYRKNDSVDIVHETAGGRTVTTVQPVAPGAVDSSG